MSPIKCIAYFDGIRVFHLEGPPVPLYGEVTKRPLGIPIIDWRDPIYRHEFGDSIEINECIYRVVDLDGSYCPKWAVEEITPITSPDLWEAVYNWFDYHPDHIAPGVYYMAFHLDEWWCFDVEEFRQIMTLPTEEEEEDT